LNQQRHIFDIENFLTAGRREDFFLLPLFATPISKADESDTFIP
jgi:hypothetical protein